MYKSSRIYLTDKCHSVNLSEIYYLPADVRGYEQVAQKASVRLSKYYIFKAYGVKVSLNLAFIFSKAFNVKMSGNKNFCS